MLRPRTTFGALVSALLLASSSSGCKRAPIASNPADGGVAHALEFAKDEPDPTYSIWRHALDCAVELGPLPPISCLDGDIVPVTVNGVEQLKGLPARCDNPMAVDSITACAVGSRFVAREDDGVTTVALCRRIRVAEDAPPAMQAVAKAYTVERANPNFQNIAVIQYKPAPDDPSPLPEGTLPRFGGGKVCYFEIRHHEGAGVPGVVPPVTVEDVARLRAGEDPAVVERDALARAAPGALWPDGRPMTIKDLYLNPGEFRAADACVRCHDTHLWLRTPALLAARADPANKEPADGGNLRIGELPLPEAPWRLLYVGKHHIDWSRPDVRPFTMHVDGAAYLQRFHPELASDRDAVASAARCTRCHAIGKSRLVHAAEFPPPQPPGAAPAEPMAIQGTCLKLVRRWVPRAVLERVSPGFVNANWKTGREFLASRQSFLAYGDAAQHPVPEPLMWAYMTESGKRFSDYYWMPDAPEAHKSMVAEEAAVLADPTVSPADAAAALARLEPTRLARFASANDLALEALTRCCDDPNLTIGGKRICRSEPDVLENKGQLPVYGGALPILPGPPWMTRPLTAPTTPAAP